MQASLTQSTPSLHKTLNKESIFRVPQGQNTPANMVARFQQRIQLSKVKHAQAMNTIDQELAEIERRMVRERETIQGEKLAMWQLKNEIMELQEAIAQVEQEEQQYEAPSEEEYEEEDEYVNEPQTLKDMLRRWEAERQESPLVGDA